MDSHLEFLIDDWKYFRENEELIKLDSWRKKTHSKKVVKEMTKNTQKKIRQIEKEIERHLDA